MGKYGKKVEIQLNPLAYNVALLGESGIGKSTIAKEVCEKLVGDEGYMHFDIGRESGSDCINGMVSEKINSWEKLVDVVDDIVENKDTYPNLKVIIWDTFDELIILAEQQAIKLHNKKNPEKKTDTINSVAGGFGKGQDKAIELILDLIWELKNVGVNPFIIGHVKRSNIIDPITQESYSKLTADTQQRYFNAIKNKMHFVGLAYIDRAIVKEKTGRKNIVTKEDIITNKVVGESRVISFRDNTYSVDSKSRFADIVDRISFSSDEFIKAMKDAIIAEAHKGETSIDDLAKKQKAAEVEKEKEIKRYSEEKKKNHVDLSRNQELLEIIRDKYMGTTDDDKEEITKLRIKYDIPNFREADVSTEGLEEIVKYLLA